MYRALDLGLIRTARGEIMTTAPGYPGPLAPPAQARQWLDSACQDAQFVEALEMASRSLADAVVAIIDGSIVEPRAVRRTAKSVWRYLQRSRYRATPFGLFAGVGELSLGRATSVVRGSESRVTRPDALWVDEVVGRREEDLSLLSKAVVVADETCVRRGSSLVLPHRPGTDRPSEVRLRLTAPARDILDLARTPIGVSDIMTKLDGTYPGATTHLLQMIASLVDAGILHTDLRPTSDGSDPIAHLTLTAPSSTPTVSSSNVAVDLVTGIDVTLPRTVAEEAECSLAVMARMSPYPTGAPAWRDYHARFLERYSLGALVPVLDLVDSHAGLGYPAGFRGSSRPNQAPQPLARDEHLLSLVQTATRSGQLEVVLSDQDVDALSGPGFEQVPGSVELTASIEASSAAALDRGDFRVVCAGLAATAGTTTGRFLPCISEPTRHALEEAYGGIPTLGQDAIRVQITAPPLRRRIGNVTRSGTLGLEVLAIGEHHSAATMAVSDLAVGATPDRLYLQHLPTGRQTEPFVMNAVELTSATHPLVRFLCELPRAHAVVMTPFSWGAARRLPFLPRVRSGRVVLSEARWLLNAADLASVDADALQEWRERWNVPSTVYLGSDDQRLHIDFADAAQRDYALAELKQHDAITLTEAPSESAYGWIGRAHQITLGFAARQEQAPEPQTFAGPVVIGPLRERVPGCDPTVLLKVYAPAEAHDEILTCGLVDLFDSHDQVLAWWFIRYQDPDHHLRIRLRLRSPDAFSAVAADVGAHCEHAVSWASDLPEYARYGTGAVMESAEDVFAADSRCALAQATIADASEREAATAASLLDLSVSLLGSRADALRWLTDHLPRAASPQELPLQQRAIELAGPRARADAAHADLIELWKVRATALARYADRLRGTGAAPDDVLASLLHMHLNRVHGIDPEKEPSRLRTTRTAALSWLKRQEPST